MGYFKGCLFSFVFVIVGVVGIYYLFSHNVINNLESYDRDAKQCWNTYVENLKERRKELSTQKIESDSLKLYMEKAKSISLTECSKELGFNEYKINQFVMADSLVLNTNDKINASLANYNEAVRTYNIYRITFPNSLIAKNTQLPKNHKYFDYRYGVDNEKVMIRKKKLEDWVKNGGEYPQ